MRHLAQRAGRTSLAGVTDDMKTPTLDDVAAAANVSAATISRWFNNPEIVAPATGERIRLAVDKLGYIPNLMAGGLASNRSRLVAVMIPQLSSSIFVGTIEAMVSELGAAGYVTMLAVTGLGEDRFNELVRAALGRRAEAIVITGTVDAATRKVLRRSGATVIEIWDLPEDPVDVAIGFSHHEIGAELARFVRGKGYSHPHLLMPETARARQRREGFIAEWQAQGGDLPSETPISLPGHLSDARTCFAQIRTLDPRPDVVICGSDLLALGLLDEASAAGLSIPGEFGVIGFGNTRLAMDARTPITSVDIDGTRIAREAIAVLRQRTGQTGKASRRIDVGFSIVERQSTR